MKIENMKSAEADRLVREMRNPKSTYMVESIEQGQEIQRVLKVIFGEKDFYRRIASKAKKKDEINKLPTEGPEDLINLL